MKTFRPILICLISVMSTSSGAAQDVPGGSRSQGVALDTAGTRNGVSLTTDKLFNTYRWIGRVRYSDLIGPLTLRLSEDYQSTVIRIDRKLITDEQTLGLVLSQRYSTNLNALVQLSSFSLSDNKVIGLNNAASHGIYGGVEYRPVANVKIQPLVGFRLDNQIDERDRGLSYLLDLDSDPLDYDGYQTRLNGRWQYDRLSPRTLETRTASINIVKPFIGRTRNSFSFSHFRNRRDFYIPTGGFIGQTPHEHQSIETRTENALWVVDSLRYELTSSTLLSLEGNLFARSIGRATRSSHPSDQLRPTFDTRIEELKLDGVAQLDHEFSEHLGTMVKFSYQERDETHTLDAKPEIPQQAVDLATRAEERKNNNSRRTSIASTVTAKLSAAHTVRLSGSGSLLRYDTPSADNNDDRDELWYIFNLATIHRVNSHLTLQVNANVHLTHLVYLSAFSSSNNTWNRIFRLAPRLEYLPARDLTTTNTFEVLANYTVYDFEFPSSPIRSFVFRQFAFIDSTALRLTQRLAIEWFSHLRLYEQGELVWAEFAQRPVNYFDERTYVGTVRYEMKDGLLFSVGIRYFTQQRYGFRGPERVLERIFRSVGPTTAISWRFGRRTEFGLRGWYEQQSQTGLPSHGIANMTMLLAIHF